MNETHRVVSSPLRHVRRHFAAALQLVLILWAFLRARSKNARYKSEENDFGFDSTSENATSAVLIFFPQSNKF